MLAVRLALEVHKRSPLNLFQQQRPFDGFLGHRGKRKKSGAKPIRPVCPLTRFSVPLLRVARWRQTVSCSYCRFAPMDCRSARMNAGSFATNAGLRGPIDAVIPGRKVPQMQVGAFSNAGCYSYRLAIANSLVLAVLLNSEVWGSGSLTFSVY